MPALLRAECVVVVHVELAFVVPAPAEEVAVGEESAGVRTAGRDLQEEGGVVVEVGDGVGGGAGGGCGLGGSRG